MKFILTPLLALLLLLLTLHLPSTNAQETCAVIRPDDTEGPITHNTYRMLRGLMFREILVEYQPPEKIGRSGVLRLGKFQKGKFGICCKGYCMKLENFSPAAAYNPTDLEVAMGDLERKCVCKARHGWSRFKSKFLLCGRGDKVLMCE
jgi:hypothetical protein